MNKEIKQIVSEIELSLNKAISKHMPKPGMYDEMDNGNYAAGLKRALDIVKEIANKKSH